MEVAPETPTGDRVYYMPHKSVVRQNATTIKVRMVFDASAKPNASAESINECMYTGPPLRHTSTSTVNVESYISRYPESFSSVIEVKEEDRDSFRFLYNINGMEKHLRFTRVPFGAEASSFVLGATRAVRSIFSPVGQ